MTKSAIFCRCLDVVKGAMCKNFVCLLTEMQYDIHDYVFNGV